IENLNEVEEAESFVNLKKNAIKLNMIKPLFNSLELTYERSLKPSINIQGTIGVVTEALNVGSVGERRSKEAGVYLKVQPKFFLKSGRSRASKGLRDHPLAGAYIGPELIFTAYTYNQEVSSYDYLSGVSSTVNRKVSNSAGAFMLNFGKQYVMSDVFTVEIFAGLGLDFGGEDDNGYYSSARRYSHVNAAGFAFDGGVRLGFVF
ncbi:MAG: hypothetical protein JKY54_12725, partial [Flavobacteriales bacterium]|nr:hypothetical protein [Flavobacteriales bacterium]